MECRTGSIAIEKFCKGKKSLSAGTRFWKVAHFAERHRNELAQ
jgi:hypothetical protein